MKGKLWTRWYLLPLMALTVILIGFLTVPVAAEEEVPLSGETIVEESSVEESEPLEAAEPVTEPAKEETVQPTAPVNLSVQSVGDHQVSDFEGLKQIIDQAQSGDPVSIKITQGFDWTSTIYLNNGKHIELSSDEEVVLLKNAGGYFFNIDNASLFLNGSLIFDINKKGNGFYIGDNAYMEINDNVKIQKSSSPAIYMHGYDSDVVMNGGILSENNGYRGGAVYLDMGSAWSYYTGGSTFTMNGGVMENNTATDGGGAVFIEGGGRFIMNDGVMRNNTSDHGGAVGTYDLWASEVGTRPYSYRGDAIYTYGTKSHPYSQWPELYPAAFIMNGGTVENNQGRVGGGIYIASNGCEINGGNILNNYASSQGGGVYVASVPYTLRISRAIVTGNNAYIGGGMWFCPTGDAEITVTDGTAIYENTASGAGDDFAAVVGSYSLWGDRPVVTISDRMLGGGLNNWYRDGSVYRGDLGGANPNVARYQGDGSDLSVTDIQNYRYALILKSLASQSSIDAASKYGLVLISGNTSRWGGGIGSNGQVLFGMSEAKEISATVQKVWQTDQKPEQLLVYLVNENGDRVDSAVLNEENGWTYTFTGLPENILFSIEEEVPEGYQMVSLSEEIDEAGNWVFLLTNAELKYGNLRIEKTLQGEDITPEEYQRAFEFLVEFDSDQVYEYTGSYQGFIASGDIIGLKHGEYIVILGLPEGIYYTISEILAEGDEYEVIAENDSGLIAADEETIVSFTNFKYPVLGFVPEEPDKVKGIYEEPTPEEVPKPKEVVQPKKEVRGVQTATNFAPDALVSMMAVSLLGLSVFKRRKP